MAHTSCRVDGAFVNYGGRQTVSEVQKYVVTVRIPTPMGRLQKVSHSVIAASEVHAMMRIRRAYRGKQIRIEGFKLMEMHEDTVQ